MNEAYAVPRNTAKLDEDQSNIEINSPECNAIEFDIETEENELKLDDNVNTSLTNNKNAYNVNPEENSKIPLSSTMIGENADENQSGYKSDAEFYITSEKIEIKSENTDISATEDDVSQDSNIPRIKSYKEKCNNDKPRRNRVFLCKICSTSYSKKFGQDCHKLAMHGEGSQTNLYKCDQCSYRTGCKRNFTRHTMIHKKSPEAKVYKCKVCQFKTKYKQSFKGHSLTHLKNSRNDKVVGLKKNMLIHDSNSVDQLYTCHLCPYITKWSHALKKHERTHKNVSELTCSKCPYKTKREDFFNRHLKMHETPKEQKSYNCNTCDYVGKSKVSLTEHLLVHRVMSEMQSYSCDRCPFKTKRKSYLKLHEMTHKDLPECYQSSFIKFFSGGKK